MKRHVKKTAAWALALCLTLGMLPCAALAEEPTETEVPAQEEAAAPEVKEEAVPETPAEESQEEPEETPVPEEPAEEVPEEEPVPEPVLPDVFTEKIVIAPTLNNYDEGTSAMPLELGTWQDNVTDGKYYRAQLSENDQRLYDELEKAFAGKPSKDEYALQYGKEVVAEVIDAEGKKTTKTFTTVMCSLEKYWTEKVEIVFDYAGDTQANFDAAQKAVREQVISDAQREAGKYNFDLATLAFTHDHPEYFWIRSSTVNGPTIDGEIVEESGSAGGNPRYYWEIYLTIDLAYVLYNKAYIDSTTRQNVDSQVKTAIQTALTACNADEKTVPTVAKLANFDNWLAKNNTYNGPAGDPNADGYQHDYMENHDGSPWNITSAFLSDRSPVCEGYAKGFKTLCDRIDVPCIVVSSSNHMWNMVKIDNNWYYVDCTWNDPGDERNVASTRDYFLNHMFDDQVNVPEGQSRNESHDIDQDLPWPEAAVAQTDYFNQTTVWYADVASGTSSDSGNYYWIAGYDAQNKMLGLEDAYAFYWKDNTDRLILPDAGSSPTGATSRKLFTVSKGDYKPVGTARVVPTTGKPVA